jgi:nucleotide-sensitive chloride channel 1A
MVAVAEHGEPNAGVVLEEDEEVRARERTHLYINERCDGTGELLVTTRRLAWTPEAQARGISGFSLFYPAIVMHAVCRDTSTFQHPCIFMQLDPEHNLGELASALAKPRDPASKRTRTGNGAPAQASEEEGEEEEGEEEDEEPGWEDLRFVPAGESPVGSDNNADALDVIYDAMCECACLNPDPRNGDDSEGEEGEEGMEAGDGVLFTHPDALASMTLQQAAALDRFDRLLDGRTGRFEDAEEEEAE